MARHPKKRPHTSFAGIPRVVLDNLNYIGLSGGAVKLLVELARQYNGKNNGDLTLAFSLMKERGINSKTTLNKYICELIAVNLIVKTREGLFQRPNSRCALYAVTWEAIDDLPDKDLELSPTKVPIRNFSCEANMRKEELAQRKKSVSSCPQTGQSPNQNVDTGRLRNKQGRYLSNQNVDR